MPIQVTCASCGTKANAPDSAAGRRGKCKNCGDIVEIPLPSAMPAQNNSHAPQQMPPGLTRHKAQQHCVAGKQWAKDGRLDFAVFDYNEAIQLDPNCSKAYAGRGSAYFKLGEYQQAIADFSEAINLEPENPQSDYNERVIGYYGRGNCYRELNEYDLAVDDYTEAIRLCPQHDLAYGCRGAAHRQRGDLANAVADLKQALRLDRNNSFAQEQLNLAKNRGTPISKSVKVGVALVAVLFLVGVAHAVMQNTTYVHELFWVSIWLTVITVVGIFSNETQRITTSHRSTSGQYLGQSYTDVPTGRSNWEALGGKPVWAIWLTGIVLYYVATRLIWGDAAVLQWWGR